MEENKIEINNGKNEISEESLEEVAGGTDQEAADCRFRPKHPFEYKTAHSVVWVKCANCERKGCRCYGTIYCEGMMHMVIQDSYDPLKWRPWPTEQRWHMLDEQIVAPLDVD